jgi:phosphomannomutase
MPEISRFFGIVVRMFYAEHGVPHFHARYGRARVSVSIVDLAVLTGSLPPRALGLVLEWAVLHRDELLANWERLRRAERPVPIPPLQ